ncbi:MAG TPA: hypothetical protein VGL63_16460 [Streptosporangiaceae bacterium]|jgi:hypothetical protein
MRSSWPQPFGIIFFYRAPQLAEAVDVFYVVDGSGRPVRDLGLRGMIAARILESLTG